VARTVAVPIMDMPFVEAATCVSESGWPRLLAPPPLVLPPTIITDRRAAITLILPATNRLGHDYLTSMSASRCA
jgi:hypothetical protein